MTEKKAVLLPTEVSKTVEPFVDMGNLVIIDNDPIAEEEGEARKAGQTMISEEELAARVRDNTQVLFNKIWELERKRIDEAICAKLPAPLMRLPREKPLPEKRKLTKWEQYAQQKGIRKRKKSRKIFDQQTQEWKPRYGYKRAKEDNAKDWLIEIPDNKDPMVDYFEERQKAKTERVSKNEMQRLHNIARSKGISSANATPLGVSTDFADRSRHELVNQINRARFATASHGVFQPQIKNEKKLLKTGKRHKYQPNEGAVSDERKKQLEILDKLSSKKPILNEERLAASQQQQSNNREEHAMNKKHKRGVIGKRSKSAIHRQQHFQNRTKMQKKARGNSIKMGNRKNKKKGSAR